MTKKKTTTTARRKTFWHGAQDERDAMRAYARRKAEARSTCPCQREAFRQMIDWLGKRTDRYRKREGGL